MGEYSLLRGIGRSKRVDIQVLLLPLDGADWRINTIQEILSTGKRIFHHISLPVNGVFLLSPKLASFRPTGSPPSARFSGRSPLAR